MKIKTFILFLFVSQITIAQEPLRLLYYTQTNNNQSAYLVHYIEPILKKIQYENTEIKVFSETINFNTIKEERFIEADLIKFYYEIDNNNNNTELIPDSRRYKRDEKVLNYLKFFDRFLLIKINELDGIIEYQFRMYIFEKGNESSDIKPLNEYLFSGTLIDLRAKEEVIKEKLETEIRKVVLEANMKPGIIFSCGETVIADTLFVKLCDSVNIEVKVIDNDSPPEKIDFRWLTNDIHAKSTKDKKQSFNFCNEGIHEFKAVAFDRLNYSDTAQLIIKVINPTTIKDFKIFGKYTPASSIPTVEIIYSKGWDMLRFKTNWIYNSTLPEFKTTKSKIDNTSKLIITSSFNLDNSSFNQQGVSSKEEFDEIGYKKLDDRFLGINQNYEENRLNFITYSDSLNFYTKLIPSINLLDTEKYKLNIAIEKNGIVSSNKKLNLEIAQRKMVSLIPLSHSYLFNPINLTFGTGIMIRYFPFFVSSKMSYTLSYDLDKSWEYLIDFSFGEVLPANRKEIYITFFNLRYSESGDSMAAHGIQYSLFRNDNKDLINMKLFFNYYPKWFSTLDLHSFEIGFDMDLYFYKKLKR